MSDIAIEAVGLSKRFAIRQERRRSFKELVARGKSPGKQYFWALHDATFEVAAGSSLGIIGQNGSGKSTALKVLTGIYRPTSGHVNVRGSVAALLEVGAGFHPELSGRENIRLNATILGFTGRQIDAMMDEIIDFADIGAHIDSPIKHYSSGMYVRLGFAVAVMVNPEILIIDEVIAVGDEEFQRKCYDHLHRLRHQGTTMVIVSHGLGQVTNLCDQALWLDHGVARELGKSHDVVRAYLDDVNQRELERAAAQHAERDASHSPGRDAGGPAARQVASDGVDGQVAPPDEQPPARRGAGEVRLTSLEFLDETGTPSGVLLSQRSGTFRLHYRAEMSCTVSSVELTVNDESESLVTVIATPAELTWDVAAGQGTIDFQAAPLLLASGGYRVRIQVHVDGHLSDAQDDAIGVTVRAVDGGSTGRYLQPGAWVVHAVTTAGR